MKNNNKNKRKIIIKELMSGLLTLNTETTPKHRRLLTSDVAKKRQHKISNKKKSTGISMLNAPRKDNDFYQS